MWYDAHERPQEHVHACVQGGEWVCACVDLRPSTCLCVCMRPCGCVYACVWVSVYAWAVGYKGLCVRCPYANADVRPVVNV